jgi:hypothetical protein
MGRILKETRSASKERRGDICSLPTKDRKQIEKMQELKVLYGQAGADFHYLDVDQECARNNQLDVDCYLAKNRGKMCDTPGNKQEPGCKTRSTKFQAGGAGVG